MTNHGIPNFCGNDEPGPWRFVTARREQMNSHVPGTCALSGSDNEREVLRLVQTGLHRKHAIGLYIRQRSLCDPCRGERPGSRGPRGCAYANGSRGPWPDDGCSAGKYACSRFYLHCYGTADENCSTRIRLRFERFRTDDAHELQAGRSGPIDDRAPAQVTDRAALGQPGSIEVVDNTPPESLASAALDVPTSCGMPLRVVSLPDRQRRQGLARTRCDSTPAESTRPRGTPTRRIALYPPDDVSGLRRLELSTAVDNWCG